MRTIDGVCAWNEDLRALPSVVDRVTGDVNPVRLVRLLVVQDEDVGDDVGSPVVEVAFVGFPVPPADGLPGFSAGFREVARARLDLRAEHHAGVLEPFV